MKRFIKKLLIFGLALLLFDKCFYIVIYYAPDKEIDKRLEYLITGKINKDVIICGSSRGARDIIACQIEQETGLSAYNISYPGSDVEFHEFLLRTLVKFNKSPKIVILAVDDPAELLPDKSVNFRFDRLYPLVKYDYITQELVARKEISVLSKFLLLGKINRGTIDFQIRSPVNRIMSCGSMPISIEKEGLEWSYGGCGDYSIEKEMPVKVKAFKNIQEICNENRIDLILVICPHFGCRNILFENRLKEVSDKETYFYVYDGRKEKVYKNRHYYYDFAHLMLNGAKIFTGEISSFLIEINENKKQQRNSGFMKGSAVQN
jgi:hypothetical protein